MIYRIEEASYGRIYQHTRDNGTFAIIGSEDKDTHKSRYDELKALIKEYESKYGHLGYNRLSGTYQYKLTGETTSEKSIIIYGIDLKDALSIAKKINQESIIWKENTFFGVIDVDGGVIERFKKSALNFSKAIKQGIGSRLMSDQTRTYGYAFEEVRIMRKNNLSESILANLEESSKEINIRHLNESEETVHRVKDLADDVALIMALEGDTIKIEDPSDWERVKNLAKDFASSQGFYGRLLRDMEEYESNFDSVEDLEYPILM